MYYVAYRDGKSIQRTNALDLKAGVPLTSCGIEEIKLLQAVLPDYQLIVVSGDNVDTIIYKGTEREKPVYLYYHGGHYGVITLTPVFLERAYFSLKCEDWRHHPCTTKCRCCQHTACPSHREIISWIVCAQCHRMIKGPECFENRQRAGVSGGKSVCQLYTKCQECGKVVDVFQRSQGKHKCGESRCPTCQKYDNPETHRCFMEPVKRKINGRDRRMTTTTRKKKGRKRTFCFLILSACRKRVFMYPISWLFKMMTDINGTFAIGCLVETWTGLCALPTTSKGMILISY